MSWTDLATAGTVGVVVGWGAHVLYRRLAPLGRRGPQTSNPPPGPPTAPPAAVLAPVPPPPGPPSPRPLRLSEGASAAGTVILHLYAQGRLDGQATAPTGFTQGGMQETLGARQGSLAKVLSRLKAAGVVSVDRRHVSGGARRMNVYRLTPLGESIARELLARRRESSTPASR